MSRLIIQRHLGLYLQSPIFRDLRELPRLFVALLNFSRRERLVYGLGTAPNSLDSALTSCRARAAVF